MGPGISAKSRGTGGHGSTPDAVREALRLAISLGEFAPGFQLRQDELAERFGTSRIPVREALKQLETEGFVTFLQTAKNPRGGKAGPPMPAYNLKAEDAEAIAAYLHSLP